MKIVSDMYGCLLHECQFRTKTALKVELEAQHVTATFQEKGRTG